MGRSVLAWGGRIGGACTSGRRGAASREPELAAAEGAAPAYDAAPILAVTRQPAVNRGVIALEVS